MNTQKTYRYNEDRWEYKETQTMRSGNTYTNYYRQSGPKPNTEEGKNDGRYQQMQNQNW